MKSILERITERTVLIHDHYYHVGDGFINTGGNEGIITDIHEDGSVYWKLTNDTLAGRAPGGSLECNWDKIKPIKKVMDDEIST